MIGVALCLVLQDSSLAADIARANDANKPQQQMQAVDKVRKRGREAVPAIVEWIQATGRNAMGILFTQFLGEIKDERISALLIEAIRDKDFFWRPTAAAALAEHRNMQHRELFRSLLKDPLWGVRASSIKALEYAQDKDALPTLRTLLNEDIYDVRAQAAKTLHAFGDDSGLPILVESLRSSVTWFDIDYGQIAREDAWTFLKKLTGDDFGFKPWDPMAERQPGLARWDAWMAKQDPSWREKVPENARCEVDTAEYVFGFELRSCQRGDFFFRVDTKNNLVLGYFNLERAALTQEERDRFDRALAAVLAVDRELPYGLGGCDFEQYHLKGADKRLGKLWVGINGRPHPVDPFIKVCREILQAKFGDVVAAEFKERTSLFRGMD